MWDLISPEHRELADVLDEGEEEEGREEEEQPGLLGYGLGRGGGRSAQ